MSTKEILMKQLEAERFKRKGVQEQLEALNRPAEGEVGSEESRETNMAKLETEIVLIDTMIAECETGLKELEAEKELKENPGRL